MKRHVLLVSALAGTTALAACSSGSGTGVVSRAGNAPADQVLSADAGTATEALDDGATLTSSARTTSGIDRDFDAATAEGITGTAQIRRNGSGGLDLIINGRTITFTAADINAAGDGFELPDGTAGIYSWTTASILDVLDPTVDLDSLAFDVWFDNPGGGSGGNRFLVIGTETDAAALAALPTASYEGYLRLRLAPETGFANYDDVVSQVRGDVALTADFGAGTVSGTVTDMARRAPRNVDPTQTWVDFAGGMTMREAAIDGNGFTGALAGDAGFNAAVGTLAAGSAWSGTFFGTDAGEAGGGLHVSGTTPGGDPFVGWGLWQTWKQ